jgi:hypothetical protein
VTSPSYKQVEKAGFLLERNAQARENKKTLKLFLEF